MVFARVFSHGKIGVFVITMVFARASVFGHGKIEFSSLHRPPPPTLRPRLTFGEAKLAGVASRCRRRTGRTNHGDRPSGHQEPAGGRARGTSSRRLADAAATEQVPSDPSAHSGRQEDEGLTMRDSAFSLTQAKYVAGEGDWYTIEDTVGTSSNGGSSHVDNVAGVKLPRSEHLPRGHNLRGRGLDRLRPGRRAGSGGEEAVPRRDHPARGAREPADRVHHPRRRHRLYASICKKKRTGTPTRAAAEHGAVHKRGAGRAGARGVLFV